MANNNSLATMRLPQAQFQPATFNPVVYEAKSFNPTILQQGLAQYEARQEKAAEKQTAIDVALGQVEDKLHNDEKTRAWFKDYKEKIQKDIQDNIDSGNFGNAIRTATRAAGKVASDSKVLDAVRASENWQTNLDLIKQRVGKDISKDTYDWYVKHHDFDIDQVFAGEDYKNVVGPVADLNIAELIKEAATVANQEKHSKTTGGTTTTNADGSGSGGQHTRSVDLKITPENIRLSTLTLAKENPIYRSQVQQWFDVQYDNLQDLKTDYLKEIEGTPEFAEKKAKYDAAAKNLEAGNGQIITNPYELLKKNIEANPLTTQLSRDWWTQSDINNTTSKTGGVTPTSPYGPYRSEYGGFKRKGDSFAGKDVEDKSDKASNAERNAEAAANDISGMFNCVPL